jgi:hypothetical protein
MSVLHQFEKSDHAASRRALQIRSMIEELRRGVALLETDIEAVIAFDRRVDPTNAAYPIAARTMKVRRNNLISTISLLEAKLGGPPNVGVELSSQLIGFSSESGDRNDKHNPPI